MLFIFSLVSLFFVCLLINVLFSFLFFKEHEFSFKRALLESFTVAFVISLLFEVLNQF